MSHNYESLTEYTARIERMVQKGQIKPEYQPLLLDIAELGIKAYQLRLISGLGWGEDSKGNIIDEYEICDANGNILYLTLSETRTYLQNLIEQAK